MEILQRIQILRNSDKEFVDACIVRLSTTEARLMVDEVWWTHPTIPQPHPREGDQHWLWEKLVARYSPNVLSDCVAVLSNENYIEGAMIYQINAKSKLEEGKGSLYVGWLATAPRNRPWLAKSPLYKGVGTVLLYTAVQESYELGLGGRVALQSLPNPRTVAFYKSKGFVATSLPDPENTLIDYELPSPTAIEWLRKEGDPA